MASEQLLDHGRLAVLDRIWYNTDGMSNDPATERLGRPLEFVASSRDDLSSFPPEVKLVTGYALLYNYERCLHASKPVGTMCKQGLALVNICWN